MHEQIFFYFTSDFHSQFENWPKIVAFLKEKRKLRLEYNQTCFILDNGDHLDRVHPITEALMGQGNIELLNKAQYDAVTIGNNEGITINKAELIRLYERASFKVVCANLICSVGNNPTWLKPYRIMVTPSGIRIGVIGFTAPFKPFYQPLGWDVTDPLQMMAQYLPIIKKEADIILVLSHLGIDQDQMLAEQYPDIDLLIGGHTHHLFKQGEQHNQTLMSAVGKFGHYVGEAIITWDHQKHCILDKKASAISIDHYSNDYDALKLLEKQSQRATQLLAKPVATLSQSYKSEWFSETPLITKLTEKLAQWTNADLAMLNAGILLDGLKAGIVTENDIHRICPHPINPCLVELTGQEVLEVIRAGLTNDYMNLEVKGFGFRGKVMGRLVFTGIELKVEMDNNAQIHLREVFFQGKPIELNKLYRVATADMFTFGHLSSQISRATVKTFFMPEFIRDLLRETVKELEEK